jgi:tape measure domain-containing protein
MADVLKEAIRIVLETEGREGVEQLRQALASVGDVSAETLADTNKLLDSLNGLNEAADKASRISQLASELERTEQELDQASRAALALTLQIGSVEKPTKAMTDSLRNARAEVTRLEQKQRDQSATLSKASADLRKAGVNTDQLATEQARLRTEIQRTAAAIQQQSTAVRAQAEANRQLKDRLAEGDEKFRRMTAANRASADALRSYKDRAAQASRETAGLSAEAGKSAGILSRLSGVFAGLFTFLSLRSAAQGIKGLLGLGDAAEKTRIRLEALYGTQEAGNRAYDSLRRLARDNALNFTELLDSAARLKTFGLEPLDGTLQALIDQNAKLGGSNETLNGIILALGQAWSKQKLQGEEILQLVERGVPVWDLLAQATGKNVQELQRLSERGELTRETIRLLIDEIGKGAQGAAASQLNTFSALFASLLDRVQRFFTEVSERGVLGFFKQQLGEINAQIDQLAASGKLQAYAQAIADTIIRAAKGIRDATAWIVEHQAALIQLGRAFVALRIGRFLVDLARYSAGMLASARATLALNGAMAASATTGQRLTGVLKAIPTGIKIGFALIGIDLAIKGAEALGTKLGEMSEAAQDAKAVEEEVRKSIRNYGVAAATAASQYARFKETVVLSAEEVSKLSESELAAYKIRLEGLREWLIGQHTYLFSLRESGEANAEQLKQLEGIKIALGEARGGFVSLAKGMLLSQEAIKNGLTPEAQALLAELEGIDASGKVAASSLERMFNVQDFRSSNNLGELASAIAFVATQGKGADDAVRKGLLSTLQQLSGEELQRFQAAAIAAFDAAKKGPAETAAVLETTLLAAMTRLAVAPERIGVAFTEMGKDALAAFSTVVENGNSTSAQIEAAFKAALQRVATPEEAKALGALLKQAGLDGKLGFDASERAAAALRDRITEIDNALNPLADDFKRLGIISQAELNRARDAARASFQAIVDGSGKSRDAINDVRRAFVAYAQAELAAVKGTDAASQQRVEAELRVLASINGVSDALQELGLEGIDAGMAIASGADQGADALDRASDAAASTARSLGTAALAAGTAGQNIEAAGAAAEATTGDLRAMGAAAETTGTSFGAMSQQAVQAYNSLARYVGTQAFVPLLNSVTEELIRQRDAVAGLTSELDEQLAQFDPLQKELEELRVRYKFVDDATLRQLAEKQQRLKQERERTADERRQLRQEREQAGAAPEAAADNAPSTGSRARSLESGRVYVVELRAGDESVRLPVQGDATEFERFMQQLQMQRATATGGRS